MLCRDICLDIKYSAYDIARLHTRATREQPTESPPPLHTAGTTCPRCASPRALSIPLETHLPSLPDVSESEFRLGLGGG